MEYPDALNLLAAIVEQARKDKGKITLQEPCPVDYFHSPRRCAREFLTALDTKVRSDAPLTIEEAAVIVMEVIE